MRMTYNYLIGLLVVFGLYSCFEDPAEEPKHEKHEGGYSKKHSQLTIENGPRQGFQYVDATGTEFNYRYITTTLTNDSVIPIRLTISFSNDYTYLSSHGGLKSKVFLLPRELTPQQQHFDNSMSKELKQFLDTRVDSAVTLDKIIHPNERLVMTFGVLTDVKYGEFMQMALISSDKKFRLNVPEPDANKVSSKEDTSTIYLALNLVSGFIIPCGQILCLPN